MVGGGGGGWRRRDAGRGGGSLRRTRCTTRLRQHGGCVQQGYRAADTGVRGEVGRPSDSGGSASSEMFVPHESYAHGSSGPPLIGKTIGALLDKVSAVDGSRDALVVAHQNIRWTYAELKSRSDAFASGLLSLGLEPGDRVGICAPNCAECTIVQFATAKAGLILGNINPPYLLSVLVHVLIAVVCRACITASIFTT